jgi:hypothetical protein
MSSQPGQNAGLFYLIPILWVFISHVRSHNHSPIFIPNQSPVSVYCYRAKVFTGYQRAVKVALPVFQKIFRHPADVAYLFEKTLTSLSPAPLLP